MKREYNLRRERQIDITTSVSQVLSNIIGSFTGSKEVVDILLPSFEEAIKTQNKSVNDGVDKTLWWKPNT